MKAERNDPCPCGSGKKYKKCCLDREQRPSNPHEFLWMQIDGAYNSLIPKLLEFIDQVYGKVAILEAWDEYFLWPEDENEDGVNGGDGENEFDPDSPELQTFMPFFFHNWVPEVEGTDLNPDAPEMPPAVALLEAHPHELSPIEKKCIIASVAEPFSFYEILEVDPGQGFKLQCILSVREFQVFERMGSQGSAPGQILYARVMDVDGFVTLNGCSTVRIPSIHKLMLIDLRRSLQKVQREVTPELLHEFDLEIREVYLDLRESILHPKPPVMTNTEGDLLVPQTLIYDIESAQEIFEALHPLCFQAAREELLEQAEMGPDGAVLSIEFPWLRKEKGKGMTDPCTVLARITIEEQVLRVYVNSQERAKKFKAELKKRLKRELKPKATLIEPIEAAIEKARKSPAAAPDLAQAELQARPEVQALLAKTMQAHWDGWVSVKLPALGNQTPIQAAKTAVGREKLEALLADFERSTVDSPMPGVTLGTFAEIRKKLGLREGR
jgi:hypothetical protein